MATDLEKFWSRVDMSGECWLWTASKAPNGYGRFFNSNKTHAAHRWIFEKLTGPLPSGMECCHKCDVKACVRPDHLFAGTRSDNMRDCANKGRNAMQLRPHRSHFNTPNRPQVRGEQQGHSKLTEGDVIEIRFLRSEGFPAAELAARFSISAAHVRKLAAGKAWRHLP